MLKLAFFAEDPSQRSVALEALLKIRPSNFSSIFIFTSRAVAWSSCTYHCCCWTWGDVCLVSPILLHFCCCWTWEDVCLISPQYFSFFSKVSIFSILISHFSPKNSQILHSPSLYGAVQVKFVLKRRLFSYQTLFCPASILASNLESSR